MKNKVVLVTGAASGIGAAIAELFAARKAKVVVSDIDEKGGKKVVRRIEKKGGTAKFIAADTSEPKQMERLVKQTVKAFGQFDVAVNNAGIGGPQKPVGDYPIEEWQKVIAINLSGVFYGMHYQIPALLENGGGSIVNIASILGKVGTPGASGYVAAKHGVVGLTENAALEYAQRGIRVNAVGPGYIETPLLTENDNFDRAAMKELKALHPMGRLGQPEEVAELVYWLASERASFVTGAYYNVDGGYLAR